MFILPLKRLKSKPASISVCFSGLMPGCPRCVLTTDPGSPSIFETASEVNLLPYAGKFPASPYAARNLKLSKKPSLQSMPMRVRFHATPAFG